MQLTATPPAGLTPSERIANFYRADLMALGASEVVAKPNGVLVMARDAAAAGALAALVAAQPHGIPMQIGFDGATATPAQMTPLAIVDAIAGARLPGVTAISWSEAGVVLGNRVASIVRLHVPDATRAARLGELLTKGVDDATAVGTANTRIPLLIKTDPAPTPGPIMHVRTLPAT